MAKRKYLYQIAIDALELTYTTNQEMKDFLSTGEKIYRFGSNNELWLERTDSRYYQNEFIIWCRDWEKNSGSFNRVFGFLRFGSFNKFRQNVYITFANDALYSWILQSRHYVEELLQLEFKQISKLDICIDFNFNVERLLIRKYKDETFDIIINGIKADNENVHGVGFMSWWGTRKRIFANPQMIVNDRDRTLTMRTYNKRKEIELESHKYYIQEYNGFEAVMYRLEIACKNHKKLKRTLDALGITDEDLYNGLENEDLLLLVFKHLQDRIVHLQKSRKPINILDAALNDL